MARTPRTAPSPERTLKAVRRLARLNGWSVAVVAGFAALLALGFGDLIGLGVGVVAIAAGVMEIHGERRLGRRDPRGMVWLVRAQLTLLGVVLVYASSRLASFDADTAMGNLTPDMVAALKEGGVDPAEVLPLVRLAFYGFYGAVMVGSLLYQGGLSLYYRSRVARVQQALATVPVVGAEARGSAVEQRFYDQVAAEMAANRLRVGFWTRALAESGGDEARCKAIYIRLRVEELRQISAGSGD